MVFEIKIQSSTPLTSENDVEKVLITFLYQIGYLAKGYDPETNISKVKESIPYKLFYECFMKHPNKMWSIEELTINLNTSFPTIYRHLNKLKSLDILDEEVIKENNQSRKVHRIRYANLSKAWNFTEAHIKVAMENYRMSVDHIQDLMEGASGE